MSYTTTKTIYTTRVSMLDIFLLLMTCGWWGLWMKYRAN